MSLGSRSGVNWIRRTVQSIERASALAEHRLADAGHVLDEEVALGEHHGHGQADDVALALDDRLDRIDDLRCRRFGDARGAVGRVSRLASSGHGSAPFLGSDARVRCRLALAAQARRSPVHPGGVPRRHPPSASSCRRSRRSSGSHVGRRGFGRCETRPCPNPPTRYSSTVCSTTTSVTTTTSASRSGTTGDPVAARGARSSTRSGAACATVS